jgi:hypothetical protein
MRVFSIIVASIYLFLFAFPRMATASTNIVINEFLPHPGNDAKEWIELYVSDGTEVTNYWIDDDIDFASDAGSSGKKQITSVVLGSDTHYVIFELPSSIFNNTGDVVSLFTPEGVLVEQTQYSEDPGSDISIGRSPDGTGAFTVLASTTKGGSNSPPQPTVTPTPLPTEKPTKEPKPTNTPKPEKSLSSTTTVLSDKNTVAAVTTSPIAQKKVTPSVRISPRPTSILGISTKSAEKKITPTITSSVMVKGASASPHAIPIVIGGILFIACGILIYFKRLKRL